MRHPGICVDGKRRLCSYEVEATHKIAARRNILDIRSDHIGYPRKDCYFLAALLHFQLLDAVAGLHNLSRLDEDGLSRGALIMDYTRNLAFASGLNRNHQSAVAD